VVGAKKNIYEREKGGEILVLVFRVKRVMDTVPLWAGDDTSQRPQTKPNVRMINKPPEFEHQEKSDEVGRLWPEQYQDRQIKNDE
jgi:hypothetical protein